MRIDRLERDGSVEMQVASRLASPLAPLIALGLLMVVAAGVVWLVGLAPGFARGLLVLGLVSLAVGLWGVFGGTQVIRVKPGLLTFRPGPFERERHCEAGRVTDLAVIDRPAEHRREISGGERLPACEITCLYDGRRRTIARGLERKQAREMHDMIERTLYR